MDKLKNWNIILLNKLLLVLLLLIEIQVFSQNDTTLLNWEECDIYFYEEYLKQPPSQRLDFIYNYYINNTVIGIILNDTILFSENISAYASNFFKEDISTLCQINFLENKCLMSEGGIVLLSSIPDKDALYNYLTKFKKIMAKEEFYNVKSTMQEIDEEMLKEKSIYFILDIYAKNSVENRILFFEKYCYKLDKRILKLIKYDLDAILKVSTPNFLRSNIYVSRKKVKKIINIWKHKLKELQQ